jgi:hypothetical protein
MTKNKGPRTYLALGDSMSIDRYTGVKGGGAVSQFYKWLKSLKQSWIAKVQQLLNDRPRKRLGYRTPNEVLASRLKGCD